MTSGHSMKQSASTLEVVFGSEVQRIVELLQAVAVKVVDESPEGSARYSLIIEKVGLLMTSCTPRASQRVLMKVVLPVPMGHRRRRYPPRGGPPR